MNHRILRFSGGLILSAALAWAGSLQGQDKDKPFVDPDRAGAPIKGDLRQFFKKPETALDFWRALRFEIEIGKYDVAAEYLRGFVGKNPTEEELLQIEGKDGIHAVLQLLAIPKWSADAKIDAEAKKNAGDVLARVNAVVRKQLGDPKRIAKFIRNLSATEEERIYAIGELRKSGALAVPAIISELLRTVSDPDAHQDIVSVLPHLSADAAPALIAALDVNNATIRLELIDLLTRKGESRAAPFLWFLAESPEQTETIRTKATEALKRFLPRQANKLPPGHVALTQEAERYAKHQVRFPDPQAVTVWQWDGKQLVSEVVPVSKAEEYFGLRFARQALALRPDHLPAQLAFLGLAVEKGFERAGLDKPLAQGAPEVKQLLNSANSDLLLALLDKSLGEQRVPAILGTVRALGERAETAAVKSAGRGTPALIRALYYPDRRVQMAAADATLRIPGSPTSLVSTRIVEILGRALAGEPEANAARPKVLVAFANPDDAHTISHVADKAGFDAVRANTGREALRRLQEAADIDVLLIEASLPQPGLDSLLSQLRADVNVGRLPLFLVAPTGREPSLRDLAERHRQESRLLEESKIRERFTGEATFRQENVKRLGAHYARESERLRDEYRRFLANYPNAWVANEGQVRNADLLKAEIQERLKETRVPPLSEAERRQLAADAILWLARMARGEVSGYDITPAESAILQALQSPELAGPALVAASRLPGPKAQGEIARVILDAKRPAELRAKAAEELVVSVQLRGLGLLQAQVDGLRNLYDTTQETKLKITLAQVLGSLKPSPADTGRRLQGYVPPLKVAPPAEAKPKPEPEKDADGK